MKGKLLFVAFIIAVSLSAQAQREKIEAAYIYQFTRYIDWCPEFKSGDFVIGVLGDSPIYSELQTLAQSKKVGTQNVVIRKYSNPSEIAEANIVLILTAKSGQLASVLSRIGSNCTLVITEEQGLIKDGASISFVEEGGKLLFELNKTYFGSHSLNIGTQLISLAKTII